MGSRSTVGGLAVLAVVLSPPPVLSQSRVYDVFRLSTATFKTEAPLETIVGTTAGGGVSGSVIVDLAKPERTTGTIRVDLATVKTGMDRRDEAMRSEQFLDTGREINRFAVFDIKGVEIGGALEPGKELPARIAGTLSVKGKPTDLDAAARVTYLRLAPEQVDPLRSGFTSEMIRVKVRFDTSFTNHGMRIPQFYFLRLSDDIQLEADLTLVRR